jgi:hypothetical protein
MMKKITVEISGEEYQLIEKMSEDLDISIEKLMSEYVSNMVAIETSGKNMQTRVYMKFIEKMIDKLRVKKTWLFSTDMIETARVTFADIKDFD